MIKIGFNKPLAKKEWNLKIRLFERLPILSSAVESEVVLPPIKYPKPNAMVEQSVNCKRGEKKPDNKSRIKVKKKIFFKLSSILNNRSCINEQKNMIVYFLSNVFLFVL